MSPVILAAGVAALTVCTILWLLARLDHLQVVRTKPIFFRRWTYILTADSFSEPGRRLLPWLRLALVVLALSVGVAVVGLLFFIQARAR